MGEVRPAAISPSSPLDGLALPSQAVVATLALPAPDARFVLRAPSEIATAAPGATAGAPVLVFARRINTAASAPPGDVTTLRLGPDEWLVLAPAQTTGDVAGTVASAVAAAVGPAAHALVDVSHRQLGLRLSGPAVEAVLSAGCPLPLDTQSFPVGKATRTVFSKAEVVLWRQEISRFHIEVARSFAPYVVGILAEVIANEAAIRQAGRAHPTAY